MITGAIASGEIAVESQIPSERELANLTGLSRVTIRKAIAKLVAEGLIEQQRGAGSFVKPPPTKVQQSLSTLESFTESLSARAMVSTSTLLRQGLFTPTPNERMILGLATGEQVARVDRLRSGDGIPMALEYSTLPQDILPAPEQVETSLYKILRGENSAPVRAIQKILASNLSESEAQMLQMKPGAAVLLIERTGYLHSGRPVEFTRGLYRSDLYDFISELRIGGQ